MAQQVYLECINSAYSEYKYWRAWIDSETYTLHTNWGRIDAPRGQSKSYSFASLSQAKAKLESLVRSKLRKGYEDKSGANLSPPVVQNDPIAASYTIRLLLTNLRPLLCSTSVSHPTIQSILKDAMQIMPHLASQIQAIQSLEDLETFLNQLNEQI